MSHLGVSSVNQPLQARVKSGSARNLLKNFWLENGSAQNHKVTYRVSSKSDYWFWRNRKQTNKQTNRYCAILSNQESGSNSYQDYCQSPCLKRILALQIRTRSDMICSRNLIIFFSIQNLLFSSDELVNSNSSSKAMFSIS